MKRVTVPAALGLVLMLGSSANAGSLTIDGLTGSPFSLESRTMAKLVSTGGLITDSKLAKLHAKLNDDGIKTNGKVTFLVTQSNLGGLSLLTLIDKQKVNPSGAPSTSSLFIETSATGDVGMIQGSDADLGSPVIQGSTTGVDGSFQWNSNGTGDAFAWSELTHGDGGSFQFNANLDDPSTFPGLKELKTFQFVTWSAGAWQVMKVGTFSDGVFSFSFAVAPLPPAALLGVIGLAGVIVTRRRTPN